MVEFDINNLRQRSRDTSDEFGKFIKKIKDSGRETGRIEKTVGETISNINEGVKSFVIYGEPQSGKTEMMIGLTAKLLDENHKVIVILLNDIVQLLNQNLNRFQSSGISPMAQDVEEIVQATISVENENFIIFCKKNQANLKKLIQKLQNVKGKIVIDDEADYATPNAKVNKDEKTKINELTEKLLEEEGVYIGVTATPARLDLNRTHDNQSEKWLMYPPHSAYIGADVFFPPNTKHPRKYRLNLLPEQGDDPKYLREAIFNFMVTAAYLNLYKVDINKGGNWSMLVHTTGKTEGHNDDATKIRKLFKKLSEEHAGTDGDGKHFKNIFDIAAERFGGDIANKIIEYIWDNFRRHNIIVLNSTESNTAEKTGQATNPISPFTIVIGGNIVSRGVTFDYLLSMFFTRDVRHKIGQDTYIQRARMFGSRKDYIEYFELSIPKKLFSDWADCFFYHRVSLVSRNEGDVPIWVEGKRIRTTQTSSIDSKQIVLNKGELNFEKTNKLKEIQEVLERTQSPKFERLKDVSLIDDGFLPRYLLSYMENEISEDEDINDQIGIYDIRNIANYKGGREKGVYYDEITRDKGFIGSKDIEKFPSAKHHFMIYKNQKDEARMFYKHINARLKFLSQKR